MEKLISRTILLFCVFGGQLSLAQQTDKVFEAFEAFKKFAKGIAIGSTYIQDVELTNGKYLKITYLKSSETLTLDEVDNGVILNYFGKQADIESKRIEFFCSSGKRCSFTSHSFGDGYYTSASWTGLGSKTEQFYVLLGNLIVACKEANIKNFKQEINYDERLKIVTSKDFIDYIPEKTKVVLKSAGKDNEYYKQLKSYIGKEVKAYPLYINSDLKTYKGSIYSPETQKDFKVSSIEITTTEDPKASIEKESEEYTAKTKKRQKDFNNMKTFSTEYLPPIMNLFKEKTEYLGEKFFIIETPETKNDAYPESYTISTKPELYYFVIVGEMDTVEFSYNGEVLKEYESIKNEKIKKYYLAKKQVKELNAAGTKRWVFAFGSTTAMQKLDKISEIKLSINARSNKNTNQYAFIYCFKSLEEKTEQE